MTKHRPEVKRAQVLDEQAERLLNARLDAQYATRLATGESFPPTHYLRIPGSQDSYRGVTVTHDIHPEYESEPPIDPQDLHEIPYIFLENHEWYRFSPHSRIKMADDIVDRLYVHNDPVVTITGERCIGKTSMLLRAGRLLANDYGWKFTHLDIPGLVENIRTDINRDTAPTDLRARINEYVSMMIDVHFNDATSGTEFVIGLDSLDKTVALSGAEKKQVQQMILTSVKELYPTAHLIITGSTEGLNEISNNASRFELTQISYDEQKQMLAKTGLNLDEDANLYLYHITAGHPMLIATVSDFLVNHVYMQSERRGGASLFKPHPKVITPYHIKQVITEISNTTSGTKRIGFVLEYPELAFRFCPGILQIKDPDAFRNEHAKAFRLRRNVPPYYWHTTPTL